jgi:hypothetical protein
VSLQEPQLFGQRTLIGLIGVGAIAFMVMAGLLISGDVDRWKHVTSASAGSKSAIGYRAFIEVMRDLKVPLGTPATAELRQSSLQIVLDPQGPSALRAILTSTIWRPILVVLPKWQAYSAPYGDEVKSVRLRDVKEVEALVHEVASDIEVLRPSQAGPWREEGVEGTPTLNRPQLVRSPALCPLVSSEQGVLIGRLCAKPWIVVLSDADLLANHNLWRGDNAVLAISTVSKLRNGAGPVIALEAVTAAPPARSIWRLALTPPFVLITFTSAIAALVALWSAAIRFGPAVAEEVERPPGVMPLIEMAVRLLRVGLDGGRLLRRYADLLTLDLGRRLHAPRGLQRVADIGAWLDATRRGGRAGVRYADLALEVDQIEQQKKPSAPAAVATALRLHGWREDLLNGR